MTRQKVVLLRRLPRRKARPFSLGNAYCDVCNTLLREYVDAGNEVVELKLSHSAAPLTLQQAVEHKRAMRLRLAKHQQVHRGGVSDPAPFASRFPSL